MLAELHSTGFALFDNLNMEFSESMNVVTGETGAGKSLFLMLLRSLFGERPNFVEGRSEIEARFFSDDQEEMVVNLKITPSRMSARLNGSIISLAELRNVTKSLMNIHTQGATDTLRDPREHTPFVDLFEPRVEEKLLSYREMYREYLGIQRAVRSSGIDPDAVGSEMEELSREIGKIERTLPTDEEYEGMKNEYTRLSNSREIFRIASGIDYSVTSEEGLQSMLGLIVDRFRDLRSVDPLSQDMLDSAMAIEESVRELSREIAKFADSQESDEGRLAELEDRVSEVERLKRRYGPTLEDVRIRLDGLKKRSDELESAVRTVRDANRKLSDLEGEMRRIGSEIKKLRTDSSNELLKRTMSNLKDLAMQNVELEFVQKDIGFTENGMDSIEFMGRMNPGTPEMPISLIASGGELSRLYLALETALGKKLPVPTVVFDEVDSGVGTRTADRVAGKLLEISKTTQLIVITHMPQVAAAADRHFKVEKKVENGKTNSSIILLDEGMRRRELKEMFGKIPNEVQP